MAIIDAKGRPRSTRTSDEEHALLMEDIGRLPPDERAALLEVYEKLAESGGADDFGKIAEADYIRKPVDVRTFLTDPYFLGETGSAMYPRIKDDIVELFEGGYHEAVLGGSLGWGKSFFAVTSMAYVLYQISCLRTPQRSYGLEGGSHLYIAMLSVTEKVARRVQVNELIAKVEFSRYFKEHFPIKAAPSQLEIKCHNHVTIVAGSTGSSAVIGLNVFASFIDETSFMGSVKEVDRLGKFISTDMGEKIYKSIIRRMKSRFQRAGKLPGVLITVSSKERPSAFVEKRIQEAREQNDPHFFVREYATWDVKPPEFFSAGTFKVVAGNERVQSRILGEDPKEEERYREMGLHVVEVPSDYRKDFEKDLDGALRDIAGVATLSVSNYFQRIDSVYSAVMPDAVSPIVSGAEGDPIEEWTAGTPFHVNWGTIASTFERRLPGGFVEIGWRPKKHPFAIRYAHIDSSLTGDATGLVIAHIANWTEVVRRDPRGDEYTETAPVMETDLVLRIVPPPGDEILLSDVRSILYQFSEHGFQIGFVSMDQFQSADTIQQMNQRGIEAEVVSIDRTTEPYDVLKGAFYEGRLRVHQHRILQCELRNIQRVPSTSGKVKIDHPKIMTGPDGNEIPGSKDVADALAGAIYNLSQRMPGQPIAPQAGVSVGAVRQEKPNHDWVTGGAQMVTPEASGAPGRKGMVKPGSGSGGGGSGGLPPLPFIRG